MASTAEVVATAKNCASIIEEKSTIHRFFLYLKKKKL
jgi:hypothetical protein